MTPPTLRTLAPCAASPTPRQLLQRNLLVDCLAERTDARLALIPVEQAVDAAQLTAVPGWGRLAAFVDGPLRAQLAAAMRTEDADHVIARIHAVITCVLSPEGRARA